MLCWEQQLQYLTSETVNNLDLIDAMYARRESCEPRADQTQSRLDNPSLTRLEQINDDRSPPWTQNIRSSMTTLSVKKSNMSVKYCHTLGLPYLRWHSV